MTNSFETPQWMQGRARGLLLFWIRELERKLQINWYLSGCSRGATLEIMTEMDRQPGDRLGTLDYPKTFDNSDQDNRHTESIRIWYHQMGPNPEAIPQQLPETWPKCLGRGTPLKLESWPPSPAPSSTSSDSSRPPSLESLTEPESGYEASISSDTDWFNNMNILTPSSFYVSFCYTVSLVWGLLTIVFFCLSKFHLKWWCVIVCSCASDTIIFNPKKVQQW